MNSDIKKYVAEILKNFGEYYDPNDPYTNTGMDEPYIRNIRYGLEIRKYWKSSNIVVKYDGITVYNEQDGICKNGVWQDLIEEYYNEIPKILKNIALEKENRKKNDALYNRISSITLLGNKERYHEVEENPSYYHDYTIAWFENGLKIVVDDYVSLKHLVTTRVFYNNEEVFRRVKEYIYDANCILDEKVVYPISMDGEWMRVIASLEMEKETKRKKLQIDKFRKSLD